MLIKYSGVAYRSHNPRWAFKPLSGEGAEITGGRFNRKGQKALYLSLSQIGALLESQQGFTLKADPKLICSYSIQSDSIINLTTRDDCNSNQVSYDKLNCAWMIEDNPYTHQIADDFIAKGVHGVLVSSFAAGADDCINLVLWHWDETIISVVDNHGDLPKNQSSWH